MIGFEIAPTNMEGGEYQSELQINQKGTQFVYSFNFTIQNHIQELDIQSVQLSYLSFSIKFEYQKIYSNQLNSLMKFKISILNNTISAKELARHSIINVELPKNFLQITGSPDTGDSVVEFQNRIINHAKLTLGLLFAISFLWLTELVPLSASSLFIPVFVVSMEVDTASNALSPFFSTIIVLFFAGFLLAEALKKTKLDHYISILIISKIPPDGRILILTMMGISAGFSMFMSNTAAAAVLIPLSVSILDTLDKEYMEYRKTLVLAIAYSATVGGVGSLIGTPPNVLAADLLYKYNGSEITFLEWFAFGLPVVLLMLPIVFIYLSLRFKPSIPKSDILKAKKAAIKEYQEELNFTKNQKTVLVIFVSVLALWLTSGWLHSINTGIIALGGAVALFFLGILEEEDLNKINWNVLLTFGGGLTLGNLVLKTGLAEWMASKFVLIKNVHPFVILLVLGLFALLLTAIASNTASAAILIPIVMPLGLIFGFNPAILAIFVSIVASIDFAIIIGTPPTMLAYSTGYYKVKEIFNTGVILDLLGWLIVSILTMFMFNHMITFIV